ncbi:MAG: glutathione S-transferase family protein [Rhodospirillaceae bacterium]
MSDITLYGFAPSSYTWSVRMACAEKGLSHDLVGADFGSNELLAVHPFNKIPAMRHGDFILHESSAIMHYIDDAFVGPALQPGDAKGRALQEQWISDIIDYMYDCCVRKIVIQRIVVPMRGGEPDEAMIAEGVPLARQAMEMTDKRLRESDFLAGDDPCLADFLMIPIAVYLTKVPEGETIMDGLDGLTAWIGRMTRRPAFVETVPQPPGE